LPSSHGGAFTQRRAGPADAAAIAALTLEAYAKWTPVAGRRPLPMDVDYDAAVLAHRFDLIEAYGELAALIETTPDGDQLLIVNVAVKPAFQGRGLGVRLMRHAEALAAQAGLKGTRLYTNKLFATNVALYAALGYRLDGEEAFPGGVVRVNMSRPLPDGGD
jgi:ribosomal protein S18 acetylase RimI-like enzyme